MHRGCSQLTTWSELGPEYGIAAEELDAIIAALKKAGCTFFLLTRRYFAFRMRGVYDVRFNNIFLNKFYLDQPTKMIQVIRHEDGIQRKIAWQAPWIILSPL